MRSKLTRNIRIPRDATQTYSRIPGMRPKSHSHQTYIGTRLHWPLAAGPRPLLLHRPFFTSASAGRGPVRPGHGLIGILPFLRGRSALARFPDILTLPNRGGSPFRATPATISEALPATVRWLRGRLPGRRYGLTWRSSLRASATAPR